MAFPTIANLLPLPCVHRHTLIPGGGQPDSVTSWNYTHEKLFRERCPDGAVAA
ncbi:hypothetical protein [Arsenophonus endosymbiont of Aleurodicus floccissimus]|uniref:hypothetical protein n=1 Tax=Arsenophonus endosymbiont of Aleurodicus floccissimus TaxID=2152761 RepID=UPI001601EC0B|nr:hypothetical protein [Arsenophonus endosymbiont of Aleurodicus floccissimus]